jgi:anti-sigma factor RsiW
MTTITETDIELLETYLDGEVTGADADALQHRLQAEQELSAALDDLRAQRMIRQSVWQSLEPDQKSADQLAWRISGAMQTQQQTPPRRTWNTWQFARFGSAAAACIVLGFFVGWVGRGHHANVSTVVSPASHIDATDSVAQVQMVPVTNEYGQVVAWQPFKDPNDAKAFVEDLHRANTAAPATGAPPDDKVKLISSEEKF